MAGPGKDEPAGRAAEADSAFVSARAPQRVRPRRRTIATNILTFAAIPSLLFWAMVIMLAEGNFAGAAQLVCVAVSAGYVGWSLK